jgi:hypothetical protein
LQAIEAPNGRCEIVFPFEESCNVFAAPLVLCGEGWPVFLRVIVLVVHGSETVWGVPVLSRNWLWLVRCTFRREEGSASSSFVTMISNHRRERDKTRLTNDIG